MKARILLFHFLFWNVCGTLSQKLTTWFTILFYVQNGSENQLKSSLVGVRNKKFLFIFCTHYSCLMISVELLIRELKENQEKNDLHWSQNQRQHSKKHELNIKSWTSTWNFQSISVKTEFPFPNRTIANCSTTIRSSHTHDTYIRINSENSDDLPMARDNRLVSLSPRATVHCARHRGSMAVHARGWKTRVCAMPAATRAHAFPLSHTVDIRDRTRGRAANRGNNFHFPRLRMGVE